MIDLKNAISLDEYLKGVPMDKRQRQEELIKLVKLSKNGEERIKKIKDTVNVILFSEYFCPDCHITIPFLYIFRKLNSNIKVCVLKRTGNEDFLREIAGEARIPTVLTLNNEMEPIGIYVEIPKELKERMINLKEDEIKNIISDYRNGKYIDLMEKELIGILNN